MKRIGIFTLLISLLIPAWQSALAQDTPALVTIQLREADGTPILEEAIELQEMDTSLWSFTPITPPCQTNNAGICQWHLSHGLYQLQFNRPLDPRSNIAVGEGGLMGFGITVGTTPITYHFTFQPDGFVYFDATPEDLIPSPIYPDPDNTDALPNPTNLIPPTTTPITPSSITLSTSSQATSPQNGWRLWIYIGIGAGIGVSWHLYNQRQNRKKRGSKPNA